MIFNPEEFISISEKLIKEGNKEVYYRSAINRAYYAAFGFVKHKHAFQNQGSSVHMDLIKYLLNLPNRKFYQEGKKLESIFKKRKDADYQYDLDRPINEATSKFVLNEAIEIIRLTKEKIK